MRARGRISVLAAVALVTVVGCGTTREVPTPSPIATAASARPTMEATPTPTATPGYGNLDASLFRPPPAVGVEEASTEFDGPSALDGWRISPGESMDGNTPGFHVEDGNLVIDAVQSEWIDRKHGESVGRLLEGDVVLTARVRANGTGSAVPAVPWSLVGIMLRVPTTVPSREDWIHWSAGYVTGPTLEHKETRTGHSVLSLIPVPQGWVELRVVRHGPDILLLHRPDGGRWTYDHRYRRPDFPRALEVLLTAQTGGESDRGDLIARFDWFHAARSPLSAATIAQLGQGIVDKERIIRELGD